MNEEHYTVHIGFRVLDPTHGVEETNEITKIDIPHLGVDEAIDIINEAIDAIHTNIPKSRKNHKLNGRK